MISSSGRFVIVYNGEICKRLELGETSEKGYMAGALRWRGVAGRNRCLVSESRGCKSLRTLKLVQ